MTLARRPAIATSKALPSKDSPQKCLSIQQHCPNLPASHSRPHLCTTKRTQLNPVALQLVRRSLLPSFATEPHFLVLPLTNTIHALSLPRKVERHHPKPPFSTTTTTSPPLLYRPYSHITNQNRRRVPFNFPHHLKCHPFSHHLQELTMYPNDERERNQTTRRAADKANRHVPTLIKIDNTKLTFVMPQPCQLNSEVLYYYYSPPNCVCCQADPSSTPTSCNMRHSTANQITQDIPITDAPCTGPEYFVMNCVYFSVSFSILSFPSICLYLSISLRHDDFTLISIMPFNSLFSSLPMHLIYTLKNSQLSDSIYLQAFILRPLSYFRLMSQRQIRYLSICWSLGLNSKL